MNILGIHLEHDASATILVDGAPAAIVEAERIIQVKHAWGPEACVAAVRRALDQTGIGASEIDAIAYSDLWDSEPFGSGSSKRDRDPAVQAYTHAASGVMRIDFPQLRDKLAIPELRRELPVFITCHAHSHAAAALYSSGFERASGLVYDGYGTCCGMMAYRYDGLCLHRLDAWQDRFLLGAGYYVIGTRIAEIYPATHMLDVPGKLMGLQGYGSPSPQLVWDIIENIFRSSKARSLEDFCRLYGPPERICEDLVEGGISPGSLSANDAFARELTASMQAAFTGLVGDCVRTLVRDTGEADVFLTGGGALNIIANRAVLDLPEVHRLYIPPNCSDTGLSLGSAVLVDSALRGVPLHHPTVPKATKSSPFLGAEMDENPAVIASPEGLFRRPLPADHPNTAPFIAAELAAGKTIGLITGRCEIGPRALGHRSILALASAGGMRQKINDTIKHREWWRPFAPVCLFKDLRKYFDLPVASPYMLLNAKVKPEARQLLASVTHVDGTARVQTVADDEPSLLRDILDRLEQLGFPPVLLNTSFNISGRPLINSATDALSVLLTTGLDAAWIEGSWFEKIGNATGKAAAEE